MWTRRKHPENANLDMTPLVDIVFLLVVFFMLSTTFIVLPGIKIDLPEASSETVRLEKEEIVLSVEKGGEIYFNKERVDESTVLQRLHDAAIKRPTTPVMIKGDREVDFGKVVTLLEKIHQAGLEQVAIITRKKEEPPMQGPDGE